MTDTNKLLEISHEIISNPTQYKSLLLNPYEPEPLGKILIKFPKEKASDVVRAAVLAEPEGYYPESSVRHGEGKNHIKRILSAYYKEYRKELAGMKNYELYNILFSVVFKSNNKEEIQKNYSREQKIEKKKLIVDFIESRGKLRLMPGFGLKSLAAILPFLLLLSFAAVKILKTDFHSTGEQILASETQNLSRVFPVRLKIPAINVDAPIEHVGVTKSGEMGVPSTGDTLGWYSFGPLPGETGNSVIAGHFDGENGKEGVFAKLHEIEIGDKLYVEDGKGKIFTFVVRDMRTFSPGYREEVFRTSDTAHLNLVTCGGLWDKSKKSYDERLVVFTDLIN